MPRSLARALELEAARSSSPHWPSRTRAVASASSWSASSGVWPSQSGSSLFSSSTLSSMPAFIRPLGRSRDARRDRTAPLEQLASPSGRSRRGPARQQHGYFALTSSSHERLRVVLARASRVERRATSQILFQNGRNWFMSVSSRSVADRGALRSSRRYLSTNTMSRRAERLVRRARLRRPAHLGEHGDAAGSPASCASSAAVTAIDSHGVGGDVLAA